MLRFPWHLRLLFIFMMYTLTHGAVVAEPLLPGLDDLRAGDVDEGEEEHQAGPHHSLAGAGGCPHFATLGWCYDAGINIPSQMMPADETPGITNCLSLPDAGHSMSAESCDGGTLRLRQCVVWGHEAASPYICRRVPCVPRPPPILLHSGPSQTITHSLCTWLSWHTW